MRVISGKARGRRLCSPPSDRVRPALDKVKEAVFNILFDVTNARVLDLFAGTGSMGLEAVSRGAKNAVFVEKWPPAAEVISKNIKICGFEAECRIIIKEVDRAIKMLSKEGLCFDLIFVDPPYDKQLVNETLDLLSNSSIIHKDSVIMVEHSPRESIPDHPRLTLTDSRKYGQTHISFLKPQEPKESH